MPRDLPPGVSYSDIPGERSKDSEFDGIIDSTVKFLQIACLSSESFRTYGDAMDFAERFTYDFWYPLDHEEETLESLRSNRETCDDLIRFLQNARREFERRLGEAHEKAVKEITQ